MALTKCKECGAEVSNKAEACPKCGAKVRKTYGCGTLILIFIVLAIFGSIFNGPEKQTSTTDTKTSQAAAEEPLTEKGKKVKQKHPDWSNRVSNSVGDKKIFIGMTDHQVIAAWGPPHKVNTTTGTYGSHEQWVMHDSPDSDYVYFQNGILTSIQQSK